MQAAFDHFTTDLNTPFDFVKEALKHSPTPRDFQGNMLSLAVSIQYYRKGSADEQSAEKLWIDLSRMIASCIMLNAVRQDLMGLCLITQRFS